MKQQKITQKLLMLLLIVVLIGVDSIGCSGSNDHIVYEEQEGNTPDEPTSTPIITDESTATELPSEEPIIESPGEEELVSTEEPEPAITEDVSAPESTEPNNDEFRNSEEQRIPCGQGIEAIVQEKVSQEDRTGAYRIKQTMDGTEYIAELSIEFREEECEYSYCFELKDASGSQLQKIEWQTHFENYPQFMDLNQDGYLDMQIVIDSAPSYDIKQLYVWDASQKQFQEVQCDETIGEIEIVEGYLKNWVHNGSNKYVYQELAWEGTTLVKQIEEEISPDDIGPDEE